VSGGLRLFIAAEPPPAVREELAHWARGAIGRSAAVRRLPADSLHLTLCFLGEQPPSAVAEITVVLASMIEPLAAVEELSVGAPAWLPPRRPRVLAVGIGDPSGGLRALQGALVAELSTTLDWHPPRERFRPHITLARMRPGSERAHELPPTPAISFTPTAATLFRSDLDPAGASYAPLASIPA
jgi:2'-5' RNA ligase